MQNSGSSFPSHLLRGAVDGTVGARDGPFDGEVEGCVVGATVGEGMGDPVGDADGDTLGDTLGDRIGDTLGLADGEIVVVVVVNGAGQLPSAAKAPSILPSLATATEHSSTRLPETPWRKP